MLDCEQRGKVKIGGLTVFRLQRKAVFLLMLFLLLGFTATSTALTVSNMNRTGYSVSYDDLDESELQYVDRTHTFTDVPAAYEQETYIKTENDDKASTGTSFLTFDIDENCTVYVAHDDRISSKPDWMSSFTDTGSNLTSSDNSNTFSLYSKNFASGTVTLGGNYGDGSKSMYSVVLITNENPPTKASGPSPANSATGVAVSADLSWTDTSDANSRDVYFGVDSTPDSSEFQGNQASASFDPGTLAESTTYYWRIDEINAYGTTTGDVWSFTTAGDELGWYSPSTGGSLSASGEAANWTFTDVTPFDPMIANDTEFDSTEVKYVAFWAKMTNTPSSVYFCGFSFGGGLYVKTADVAETITGDWQMVRIDLSDKDSGPGTYTGDRTFRIDLQQSSYSALSSATVEIDWISLTNSSTWDGYDRDSSDYLWDFTSDANAASHPKPEDAATGVGHDMVLEWWPGAGATSSDVYFGTDSTPDSGEFEGNQSGTSFDPGTLDPNTTYYWRIDEVEGGSTTTGDVWSFTTSTGDISVTNPGWEIPNVDGYEYRPSGSSWSWDGNGYVVADTGSAWGGTAYAGSQYGVLQGVVEISQSISGFEVGHYYTVSWFEASRSGSGSNDLRVLIDSTVVGALHVVSDTSWNEKTSVVFTATSTSHTLKFDALGGAGGDRSLFLDSVVIEESSTPPEVVVLNPGWEYPDITGYQYSPSGSDWSYTGSYVIADSGSAFGNTAYEGSQNSVLQQTASIWQNISGLVSGKNYRVSWFEASRSGSGSNDLQVWIDSMVVGALHVVSDVNWVEKTSDMFTATSNSHTLTFDALNSGGGDRSLFLDSVSIAMDVNSAYDPSPADLANDVSDANVVLSWDAGECADTHKVYFGSDYDLVASRDANVYEGEFSSTSRVIGALEEGTLYYWAVDEVNSTHSDSPWTGNVWSFSTSGGVEVDGAWLKFRGERSLLIGDSVTQGWMEGGPNFDYEDYVDELASRNINMLMIWSYIATSSSTQIGDDRIGYDAPEYSPWVKIGSTYNLNSLNQTYFDALKDLVSYANENDIVVLITIHDGWPKTRFSVHPFNTSNGGPLTSNSQYVELSNYSSEMPITYNSSWSRQQKNQYFQEKFCDALINAVGYYPNVIFEIFNEGEWYNQTNLRAHQVHFLDYIKARTDALTMVNDDHVGGTNFRGVSNCDIISLHKPNWDSDSDAYDSFNHYDGEFYGTPTKPVYFGEPVPEWQGESTLIDAMMRLMWGTAVAGCGYVVQNDASFGFDPYANMADEAYDCGIMLDREGHCADFFNYEVDLSGMGPNGSLSSSNVCLASSGSEYVVYSQSGSSFTVNLSAASGKTMDCRFYNPRTGSFNSTFQRSGGSSSESFTKPSSSDWVLHILEQ